eukprot:gene34486-40406_t
MRPTGNVAFDEWRDAELTRLEEARRKLDAAQQEFAEYMENLRRAKDREEFDRFMSQRGRGTPPTETGHNPSLCFGLSYRGSILYGSIESEHRMNQQP